MAFYRLVKYGAKEVKGSRSPTCCLLMTLWFFVRRGRSKWRFCSSWCGLRQSLGWRLIWIKVSSSRWEGWKTWINWLVNWVARWEVFRPLIWGCRWGLLLILWQLWMILRKASVKDWLCGSDNISLRAGELHWFVVLCSACLFILCPFSICQE